MIFAFLSILYFTGCMAGASDNTLSYHEVGEVDMEYKYMSIDSSEIQTVDLGYDNIKLVGKLERKIKSVSEKEMKTTHCKDWLFKESDLDGLLKSMEKVDPVQWNMLCYDYPCYYEGKARNEEREYTIIINGASYIKLYNPKETIIFIYKQKSPLFLTPCDCCE